MALGTTQFEVVVPRSAEARSRRSRVVAACAVAAALVLAAVVASQRSGQDSMMSTQLRSFHVTGHLELPEHHRRHRHYDDEDDDTDLENEVDDLQDEMSTVQSDLRKLFAQRRIAGPPGKPGTNGKPGPRGPKGSRGRTGKTGRRGKRGRRGARGRPGPRGRTGAVGKTGATGSTGSQGPKGSIGPAGPAGAAGTAGAVGPPGPAGPVGPPGPKGDTGPTGPAGESGAAGVAGPKGADGLNGVAGPPGRNGKPGKPGRRGPRGRNGKDGRDGRRGPRGGRGPRGRRGARGATGRRGPRGPRGKTAIVRRRRAPRRRRGYAVHYWDHRHAIRHLSGLFRGPPTKVWTEGSAHINVRPSARAWRGHVHKHDRFSLRIHAVFYAPRTGRYRFHTGSDDGSFTYVDGVRIIHNDGLHGMRWRRGSRHLTRGKHHIRIDFFENGGHAGLGVKWDGPGVRHGWLPVFQPGARSRASGSARRSKFHGPVRLYWGSQVDRSREGKYVENAIKRVRGVTRVTRFSSKAAREWLAVRKTGAVVIPELERGSLKLDAAARRALRSSVAAGASLLVMGSMKGSQFINDVFGTRLRYTFAHCTAKKTRHAARSRFSKLRHTLHYKNAVFGLKTSSLGRHMKSVYQCNKDRTTVARLKHGKGHVFYLGFDWFENSHDAQWVSVLDAALKH